MFMGINNFCPEQELISLKRVSPFLALWRLRYPMEVKTFKRKAFQALTKQPWYFLFHSPDNLDTKCTVSPPPPQPHLCVLVKFYICISQENQLSIIVFSCIIVHTFTFLVVIILTLYIIWVYMQPFNADVTVFYSMQQREIYSVFCRFHLLV